MLGPCGDLEGCAVRERQGREHGIVVDAVELLSLLRVRGTERHAADLDEVSFQAAGLPRQANTSETQIPCPFVHRFFPAGRTRTGMLPGRLRSLRFRKNIIEQADCDEPEWDAEECQDRRDHAAETATRGPRRKHP